MSKALVIKGASFAANKVETVTIGESVPCTGISLSESTIALDTLNETVTLVATLTPLNATDELSWASSDENVATVSDGVVTCVGVGSATITATCGTQVATCSVSATIVIVLDDVYHVENGAKYSNSLELPTKNYVGRTTDIRGRLYYSSNPYGDYRAFVNTENAGKYSIPLPKGATKITIDPPEGMHSGNHVVLVNADEKQTYVSGADGESVLGIHDCSVPWDGSFPYTWDISEYTDANGFIASILTPSGGDASQITAKTTLIFS